jgi:RNA polymerase sigma-70 factor (ECF subfamily)
MDDELMLSIAAGDASAFDALHQRWNRRLMTRLCVGSSRRDLQTREDIVQETWIRVWKFASQYRPNGHFDSWLFRIADSCRIDMHRRGKVSRLALPIPEDQCLETLLEDKWSALIGSVDRMISDEEQSQILDAMETIPSEQADVLSLVIFCGMTHPEIAERLNILVATSKSRYRLAKEKICEALGLTTVAASNAAAVLERSLVVA